MKLRLINFLVTHQQSMTLFAIVLSAIFGHHTALSCKLQSWNPFDFQKQHIAALILARGGSKGIKLKNLATINRESLLKISLVEIRHVPNFDSVWVSTDDLQIFREVDEIDKNVNIHWRCEESATDTASSIFAIQEFLAWRPEIDAVALIQCTSPFIKFKYLRNAVALFLDTGVDCVFSVTKAEVAGDGNQIFSVGGNPSFRISRRQYTNSNVFPVGCMGNNEPEAPPNDANKNKPEEESAKRDGDGEEATTPSGSDAAQDAASSVPDKPAPPAMESVVPTPMYQYRGSNIKRNPLTGSGCVEIKPNVGKRRNQRGNMLH